MHRVGTSVDTATLAALDAAADADHRSRSGMLRVLVVEALEARKRKAKEVPHG